MSRPGSKAVSWQGRLSKAMPEPGPLNGLSRLKARLSFLGGCEPQPKCSGLGREPQPHKSIHTSSLGLLIGKRSTTLIDDHCDHLSQSLPSHKMKMLKTWSFNEDGLGGISKDKQWYR